MAPKMIRLLRLLPSQDRLAQVQCQLFEYDILQSDTTGLPYEALSYCWGDKAKLQSIDLDGLERTVTRNLHAALLRLRDCRITRTIWVDAICINQDDEVDKRQQIYFMPAIYAKASRVLVWLGDSREGSDLALETIRLAGEVAGYCITSDPSHKAVLSLLRRPWFRRVWVWIYVMYRAAMRLNLRRCSRKWPPHDMC